ncbi:MAG: hypothetical protein Q9O62_09750 [Ardenticatenia bacterium]|nr:hypothetical protein [Ardenticatenia bacterium]
MEWQREPNPILETLTVLLESRATSLILSFIVIPALLVAALWLPPISIGERVLDNEFVAIPESGGSVNDPDGTQVVFLAEGLSKPVKATMSSVPRVEFLAGNVSTALRSAAAALPAQLVLKSPIYQVRLKGEEPTAVVINIPIPNDAEPYVVLDVYEWTGDQWAWLPHKLYAEDEQLELRLNRVPRTFAVVQAQRTVASVGADIQRTGDFVARAGPALTEASPRLYMMNEDGTISQLMAEPEGLRDSGAVIVPYSTTARQTASSEAIGRTTSSSSPMSGRATWTRSWPW